VTTAIIVWLVGAAGVFLFALWVAASPDEYDASGRVSQGGMIAMMWPALAVIVCVVLPFIALHRLFRRLRARPKPRSKGPYR
jgi:hypothetical protein